MGRELRRKQAKKSGKSLEREATKDANQIKKYLFNIFVIVGVFSIIYIISALFITKELDWFSKDEAEKDSEITNLVNNNLAGDKVYKVNTKSAMNANYVGDISNKNAKTLSELKVVAPTLIKISGEEITEYYEKDEIANKLS